MSETEQILDRYTEQQGWSKNTQLDLALAYIENQSSPEDWDDYLRDLAAVDNEMDDDVDWMCAHCRDAITFDVSASPQVWVGSDGAVTCPESDRPHGPAVPDTAQEEEDA